MNPDDCISHDWDLTTLTCRRCGETATAWEVAVARCQCACGGGHGPYSNCAQPGPTAAYWHSKLDDLQKALDGPCNKVLTSSPSGELVWKTAERWQGDWQPVNLTLAAHARQQERIEELERELVAARQQIERWAERAEHMMKQRDKALVLRQEHIDKAIAMYHTDPPCPQCLLNRCVRCQVEDLPVSAARERARILLRQLDQEDLPMPAHVEFDHGHQVVFLHFDPFSLLLDDEDVVMEGRKLGPDSWLGDILGALAATDGE